MSWRLLRLNVDVEVYDYLEALAKQASQDADRLIGPAEVAEILLTDSLRKVAKGATRANGTRGPREEQAGAGLLLAREPS